LAISRKAWILQLEEYHPFQLSLTARNFIWNLEFKYLSPKC
jgi:hypothetical protein